MAPSLLYDFDLTGLYATTARNIADAQRSDGPEAGMVPTTAPQYVVFEPKYSVFNDSPEWGSAAVLAPWYAYERTGDRAVLAVQYGVMRAYAKYLGARAHNGIVDYGLGDWFDIGPGDAGFSKLTTAGVTGTAIYYQDLKALRTRPRCWAGTRTTRLTRNKRRACARFSMRVIRRCAALVRQRQPDRTGNAAGAGLGSRGSACRSARRVGERHLCASESHYLRRSGLSLRGRRAAPGRAVRCSAGYAGTDRRAELR